MTNKGQIELLKKFCQLATNKFEYDSNNKLLKFSDSEQTANFFREKCIIYEERRQKLIIEKKNLPFKFYKDKDEFIAEVSDSELSSDVLIFNNNVHPFTFLQDGKTTYIDFVKVDNNFLISNAQSYFRIYSFFKNQSTYVEGEFEFVDFYSQDTRRIVLNSITEKNRAVLEFPKAGILVLNETVDYAPKIGEFIKSFDDTNKHFPTFLKNAIIKYLATVAGNKFEAFFDKIDEILNTAKVNFNVYLHELSLEKIQTEYDEYKERYFNAQTSILSKISNQIIALPISIAGSAFAIYKLKESLFAVMFILFGILAVTGYLSFLISIYWKDLLRISERINSDFEKLSIQSFFKEHKDELKGFEKTKNWLIKRTRALKNSLMAFYIISWSLNICLVYFGLSLIIKHYSYPQWLFFIVVVTFLMIGSIFNTVFTKEES